MSPLFISIVTTIARLFGMLPWSYAHTTLPLILAGRLPLAPGTLSGIITAPLSRRFLHADMVGDEYTLPLFTMVTYGRCYTDTITLSYYYATLPLLTITTPLLGQCHAAEPCRLVGARIIRRHYYILLFSPGSSLLG